VLCQVGINRSKGPGHQLLVGAKEAPVVPHVLLRATIDLEKQQAQQNGKCRDEETEHMLLFLQHEAEGCVDRNRDGRIGAQELVALLEVQVERLPHIVARRLQRVGTFLLLWRQRHSSPHHPARG
jgi:hypothetical protein